MYISSKNKNYLKNIKSRLVKEDSGAIIIFVAFALVAIIGVAALSIDQNRALLSHREAENLADAVALAAARGLDGTEDGWDQAARLALFVLKETNIQGVSTSDIDNVSGFNGNELVFGGSSSNIAITLERGFYSYPDSLTSSGVNSDDIEGTFRAFTGKNQLSDETYHLPASFLANAVRASVTIKEIGAPFRSALNSLLGVSSSDSSSKNILGQAIATRHEELQQPVFPIAIPACELLTDLNPYSNNRYKPSFNNLTSLEADMPQMCGREVVAREPRALQHPYDTWHGGNLDNSPSSFDNAKFRQRVDGNLRSESYPLTPLVRFSGMGGTRNVCYKNKPSDGNPNGIPVSGLQPNCKAFPLNAILGVPNMTTASGVDWAKAEDVANVLKADIDDPIRIAKLGSGFAPLNGPDYLDNNDFQRALEDILSQNGPNRKTIADVFYDDPNDIKEGMKRNFPRRRNLRFGIGAHSDPFAELRDMFIVSDPENPVKKSYVDDSGRTVYNVYGEAKQLGMLMGNTNDNVPAASVSSLDPSLLTRLNSSTNPDYITSTATTPGSPPHYTNPMCHDPSVDFDNKNANAVEGYAMLIATENGEFCDMDAQMLNNSATSVPDNKETRLAPERQFNPVVVGYIKVNLFDFRIKKFSDESNNSTTPPVLWLKESDGDIPGQSHGNTMTDINPWSLDLDYLPEFAALLNDANIIGGQQAIAQQCLECQGSSDANCLDATDLTPDDCTNVDTDSNYVEDLNADAQTLGSQINGTLTSNACDQAIAQHGAENVHCNIPSTTNGVPNWMIDCFSHLGVGIAEAGQQLDQDKNYSCYQVCGGVYLPTSLVNTPIVWVNYHLSYGNDILTGYDAEDVAIYKLLSLPQMQVKVDAGDDYSWVGYDENCVAGVQNGGDISGIDCSSETGASAIKPTASVTCEDVCARALEDNGFFSAFSNGSDSPYDDHCRNDCEQAGSNSGFTTGATTADASRAQQNNLTNRLEEFDLEAQPPLPPDSETQAILRAVENAEDSSGATQVCLPRKRNGYYDVLSPLTWELPKPRDAGWGCGGIRLRMGCEIMSYSFGLPFDELKPGLVGK